MRNLNDEHGASGGGDRNTESQKEAPTHELVDVSVPRRRRADGTGNDESTADKHTHPSAEFIVDGANERKSSKVTDLVQRSDDTSPGSAVGSAEFLQESLITQQGIVKRAIIAVHSRAEEADKGREEKNYGSFR